jgi:hypothetical protein
MHNIRAGFLTSFVQIKYGAIKIGKLFKSEWKKTPMVRLSYVFATTSIVMAIITTIAIKMAGEYPKPIPIPKMENVSAATLGRMAMEVGYFEGQKDAVEGSVRIRKKDSTWTWARSPWDYDTNMANIIYHPELGQKGSVEALLKGKK